MEQSLQQILDFLGQQNIFVVCAVIFVAAILQYVFPPVPSDVLLVALGILAGTGTYNGWVTCLTYAVGAMAGSFGLYSVCYRYGEKVLKIRLIRNMITEQGLEKSRQKAEKYGGPSLLLMRFVPSLQVVALICFGLIKYPKKKMLFYVPLVSLVSSAVFCLIGYVLADNIPKMLQILSAVGEAGWIALGVIAAAVAVYVIYRFIRKKQSRSK